MIWWIGEFYGLYFSDNLECQSHELDCCDLYLMTTSANLIDILGKKSDKIRHLRGLPQGCSLSPILFNFFIDSFIRKIQKENLMMDFNGFRTNNLFFADDGNIHSNEAEVIQKILDHAV